MQDKLHVEHLIDRRNRISGIIAGVSVVPDMTNSLGEIKPWVAVAVKVVSVVTARTGGIISHIPDLLDAVVVGDRARTIARYVVEVFQHSVLVGSPCRNECAC